MRSGDLKVAWSLAALEANLCRGSAKIAFSTQYAGHLPMAASNKLYQFCDFYLCFAIAKTRNANIA